MFSIIIPTFNNFKYLKLCLHSIKKNSLKNHETIVHVSDGSDGTLDFVKKNDLKYTFSDKNIGLCSAINSASKLTTSNYILYSHDDMYFCPKWDHYLLDEIDKIGHDNFYFSGTMIEPHSGHIKFNCGENIEFFNGDIIIHKLLLNFGKIGASDFNGKLTHRENYSVIKFENNLFIDNTKFLFNKFNINRDIEHGPKNFTLSGIINLKKLNLRINELISGEKIIGDKLYFIEKNLNDIFFSKGLLDLFDLERISEFISIVI